MSENDMYAQDVCESRNDKEPIFSWAYALLGIFGYFFHRNQTDTSRPFWKCAGIDISVWMIVIGIVSKIIDRLFVGDNIFFVIMLMFAHMAVLGLIGAWRFNKYKRTPFSADVWKKRERKGLITGIIVWVIYMPLLFVQNLSFESSEQFSQEENFYYAENGIACDKFFDVSDGMSIETDEQIDNALLRIHIYCPNDVVVQDTINDATLKELFPQLNAYNFDEKNHLFTHMRRKVGILLIGV